MDTNDVPVQVGVGRVLKSFPTGEVVEGRRVYVIIAKTDSAYHPFVVAEYLEGDRSWLSGNYYPDYEAAIVAYDNKRKRLYGRHISYDGVIPGDTAEDAKDLDWMNRMAYMDWLNQPYPSRLHYPAGRWGCLTCRSTGIGTPPSRCPNCASEQYPSHGPRALP